VILILSVICFGFILPAIQRIFVKINEIELKNIILNRLKDNISLMDIDRLNLSKYTSLNNAIDTSTSNGKNELFIFRDNLFRIASELNIKVLNERLGEISLQPKENALQLLSLKETPFEISLAGDLNNMFKFIEILENYDQIIIVREMKLTQDALSELWNLRITISKFSFEIQDTLIINDDLNYSLYNLPQKVEKFLLNFGR
jgi:hypothetical protein